MCGLLRKLREAFVVIALRPIRHPTRVVRKIQIMNYRNRGHFRVLRQVAIGREKHIGLQPFKNQRQTPIKPKVPKPCAAGRWRHPQRSYVISVDKGWVVRRIKQKIKVHLRVILNQSATNFMGKSADAFQLMGAEQTRVDSYFQKKKLKCLMCV